MHIVSCNILRGDATKVETQERELRSSRVNKSDTRRDVETRNAILRSRRFSKSDTRLDVDACNEVGPTEKARQQKRYAMGENEILHENAAMMTFSWRRCHTPLVVNERCTGATRNRDF